MGTTEQSVQLQRSSWTAQAVLVLKPGREEDRDPHMEEDEPIAEEEGASEPQTNDQAYSRK